jgi:hypothetical protein
MTGRIKRREPAAFDSDGHRGACISPEWGGQAVDGRIRSALLANICNRPANADVPLGDMSYMLFKPLARIFIAYFAMK